MPCLHVMVWRAAITRPPQRYKSDERQRRQLAVKARREVGEAAGVFVEGRRAIVIEIAPALVRALRTRRDQHQPRRADDVDPAVGAILEAQDLLAGDQAVLDD